jgi:hypothetical protein
MGAYEEAVVELVGHKVPEHRLAFVLGSVFWRWCPPRPDLKPRAGIATQGEHEAEGNQECQKRGAQ